MAKKKDFEGSDPEKKDTKKEKNPYKISWFDRIPYWIKAVFIKWWFFAMIYFFFVMGIAGMLGSGGMAIEIQIIVVGLAFGALTDLFTNNILEVCDSAKKESRWWAMWAGHKYYIFLVNIVYGFALGVATSFACAYFVSLIDVSGESVTYWFREPCSFGLVALAIDLACIGIKDLIVYFVTRAKNLPEKEGLIKK